jgi:hemerythrin superfamily protein
MNGIELLKQDHRKVDQLFKQAEATEDEGKKQELFEQIKYELEVHTHIEETVLYPALEKREELKDLTLEAVEEHRQVKTLLREISNLVEGSEKFDAKLKVMSENVEHHVEEEEEEMFPKMQQLFSESQIEKLGQELAAAKQEYGKQPRTRSTAG